MICPVVVIEPLAPFGIGTTILNTTPVLLVKISVMLPAWQLTEIVEPVVLNRQVEPPGGVTLQGKLVQVTSPTIALTVPLPSAPLGRVKAAVIFAPYTGYRILGGVVIPGGNQIGEIRAGQR